MDTLDMLIFYSFNLGIFTIIFFVLGMIKPKWPLFFLKEPTRFAIVIITTVMIMIVMTMYGEGNRRLKQQQAKAEKPAATDMIPEPETPTIPAESTPKPQPAKPVENKSTQDLLKEFEAQ